jgi:hypothetical protein
MHLVRPHSPGAQFIAKRRTERNRGPILGHQCKPLSGAHGKIPCAQIINGHLRCHRAQHQPYEAHVMVVWKPGHPAVIRSNLDAISDDVGKVAHDRLLGNYNSSGKPSASRSVLDVCHLPGFQRPQLSWMLGQSFEGFRTAKKT